MLGLKDQPLLVGTPIPHCSGCLCEVATRVCTYLRAGLIDMLVCDDVAWAVEFVASRGLSVARLELGA
jgi:hypothetical protein